MMAGKTINLVQWMDIPFRSVLDLGTLLPTPKDGIVTPISFRVKRRGLRGFLAQADAAETGKRQITGEWVINKRLWKRMQTEFAMNKAVRKDRVILYLHGGTFQFLCSSFLIALAHPSFYNVFQEHIT